MEWERDSYRFTRFVLSRGLGLIYFVAFLILVNQFKALCGEHGLEPARLFVTRVDFWQTPSLFFLNTHDSFVTSMAYLGLALSVVAALGLAELFSTWLSVLNWAALWILYLSFVNIGQIFYAFGWETLILETGFLAIFFGSVRTTPSKTMMWLLRWILFRLMFGAGLIKLRGDECWRDFTCLYYHYETQPSPGPLSWYFHHFPAMIQRLSVGLNHFVEVVVPLFYFGPRRLRIMAGILTIIFQTILILSGNLTWFNCLAIVIALACFDDDLFGRVAARFKAFVAEAPARLTRPRRIVVFSLAAVIAVLSIEPVANLLSREQRMNSSFEPLHRDWRGTSTQRRLI